MQHTRRVQKKTELLLLKKKGIYCSFYSILSTVPFKVFPCTGETGQMAVCCQNLPLGALVAAARSVFVGALFKKFGLFLNTSRILNYHHEYSRMHDTIELLLLAHKGLGLNCLEHVYIQVYRLTPNDPYMGRIAPLTSKRFILYIYSTNIGTEYFKHALYSPFFLFKMQFVS